MNTYQIFHKEREYAKSMGNPVLATVKAESKEAAEKENSGLGMTGVIATYLPFSHVDMPKCSCFGKDIECICAREERILRAYNSGEIIEPMREDDRNWCYKHIRKAIEFGYTVEDAKQCNDKQLAHQVLCSWSDYVQSMY